METAMVFWWKTINVRDVFKWGGWGAVMDFPGFSLATIKREYYGILLPVRTSVDLRRRNSSKTMDYMINWKSCG